LNPVARFRDLLAGLARCHFHQFFGIGCQYPDVANQFSRCHFSLLIEINLKR